MTEPCEGPGSSAWRPQNTPAEIRVKIMIKPEFLFKLVYPNSLSNNGMLKLTKIKDKATRHYKMSVTNKPKA